MPEKKKTMNYAIELEICLLHDFYFNSCLYCLSEILLENHAMD